MSQVDNIVHLSLLEECWISLAVHLHHLPSHRWQLHLVLASRHVWPDDHALARGVHLGLVHLSAFCLVVEICGVAPCEVAVQVVIYEPRRVVALQCEHNLERVSQVVVREVVHQRLLSLVITSHHTSGEFHFRSVVEMCVSHVAGECVSRRALVVSVADEIMSVHHGLYCDIGVGQHLE